MNKDIYSDIAERTDGDIYIGIVGPVRTGKSTFIKRFMESLVIPNIDSEFKRERAVDELPQSAAGKTIMTTEPKFIPEEAVEVSLDNGARFNVRMIDCVGYIVPSSLGYIENEMPRMVMTSWFDEEIPFNMAAEIGTQKVISDHSTIGLVVTTDGSISDIPRNEYEECEERVIRELKELGKPFVVIMNSVNPNSHEVRELCETLTEKYDTKVIPVNCLELNEQDIKMIIQEILFSFPIKEINIKTARWINSLEKGHWLKTDIMNCIRNSAKDIKLVREAQFAAEAISDCPHILRSEISDINLGKGSVTITAELDSSLFYKILGEATGIEIESESDLMPLLMELNRIKKAYERFEPALAEVEATGYGIVMPELEELSLEEPKIIKQGGKYGVKLKASAPSIHLMKANINTTISPIVGSEKQSEELIMYLLEGFEEKYGMEYTKAYKDEKVDQDLMNRHWHDIFPLMHKRYLFAPVENFLFYDVWDNGTVNENIFAYSNVVGNECTIVFYNNKYERAQGWIKQSCEYAVKTGSDENDKVMVSKSLAESMGFTYGYNHYVIFREHRSGLWFVRRSDDLINNGMFVALNGFEYQVYLDVQQVVDGTDGKYFKLNELLNGSGVPDLEIAWQEFRYKDLFAALKNFVTKEFMQDIHALFSSDSSKEFKLENKEPTSLKKVLKSEKDAALAYYEKENEFALEEEKLVSENSKKKAKSKKSESSLEPEQKFKAFEKCVEYLYEAYSAPEDEDSANNLELEISSGIKSNEFSAEILCAFAAVASAGGENCRKWGYSRKLSEIIESAGFFNSEMRDNFIRIFESMKISSLNFGTSGFVKSTYTVAKSLVDSENSFVLTGANEYNGVRWFNKEKMDATLWYAFASNCMTSKRILREQIFRLYRTLFASKELAEYKCEQFTEAVKPVKMPAPKTEKAKKSSAEKTDAKKPAAKKTKKDSKSSKSK